MHTLNQYKAQAGRMADDATRIDPAARTPAYIVAGNILAARRTHSARAALLAGLVVGALVERGHADIAERVTIELAKLAGMTSEGAHHAR